MALIALGGGYLHEKPADERSVAGRVARIFSPEMRRTEARLGQLEGDLAGLPQLLEAPFASRYGFRSETLLDQEKPEWVQIDLKRSWMIDRIAAVPVRIPGIGKNGVGYGFPLRLRIEVANNPEMEGAVTVVERTAEDVENPGRYPLVFHLEPVEGRYVRFTSTRHVPVDGGFIWALQELVVLSGNNCVGVRTAVTASSSLELFPNWAKYRINDGLSALGMPVTVEASPSRGYVSDLTQDPHLEKWLEVDLGQEYAIDEIRLLPVETEGFQVLGWQSFPREWTVELASDPEFTARTWSVHQPRTNVPGYPGRCANVVPSFGHRGRYLRLTTQDMWSTRDQSGFGLAEIQAYSGGGNVALGKPVRVKDKADLPRSAGWAPDFVVDGFTSLHRLIEYPDYLELIEQRGRMEKERELLNSRRDGKVRATGLVLGYGGGGLGTAAVLGLGWMLVRQRTVRARAVALLRDQIARDLHDDIGSNLGGILLLSEMGSRHSGDAQAREDFATIREAAEGTSQSMQDIVWLIERGNTGLRELVARMRRSTQVILGEEGVSLTVDPLEIRDRELSLFFRRHVFFAFKETLNNVRKHAGADTVEVRIAIDARELRFEVRDEGVGFDPQQASQSGHGIANLRRRTELLKGECMVKSSPGQGTCVSFKAPFKSSLP